MKYQHLTINELQNYGIAGDEGALAELGRRVLDMTFCYEKEYCVHEDELESLRCDLDNEIPDDCPHCGKCI